MEVSSLLKAIYLWLIETIGTSIAPTTTHSSWLVFVIF